MRLATLANGTRDGRLMAVSADHANAADVSGCATLQSARDDRDRHQPALEQASHRAETGFGFDPAPALAPLPRAYQGLDGSAYLNHGRLMQKAFNLAPNDETIPLIYQGAPDDFLGGTAAAQFPDPAQGIDFEAEFGAILGDVPMGTIPADALTHIRRVVLLNDWSLRAGAPQERKAGFGFLQAKPATAFAPLATARAMAEAGSAVILSSENSDCGAAAETLSRGGLTATGQICDGADLRRHRSGRSDAAGRLG